MALQQASFLSKPAFTIREARIPAVCSSSSIPTTIKPTIWRGIKGSLRGGNNSWNKKVAASAVPNSNYVVPIDNPSSLTRPLAEILRDLNKRVPDNIIDHHNNCIQWYHANRMLSFYAPGWCGEISDVIFSENGSVTVIYRVTIRGSDGEAHRESSGTVSSDGSIEDPVAAAEEIAFCRACARFGLGLYLYHEDETE